MKSICQKHDRAYEVSEGCCYCVPEVKGAVAVLAQATPVAAVPFAGMRLRCTRHVGLPDHCTEPATWTWLPVSAQAKTTRSAARGCYFCDDHHNKAAPNYAGAWSFEKIQ